MLGIDRLVGYLQGGAVEGHHPQTRVPHAGHPFWAIGTYLFLIELSQRRDTHLPARLLTLARESHSSPQ